MDTVKILKPPAGGTVNAIISKSAAHRLLIAGFLSGIDIGKYCKGSSEDITATKECLAELDDARKGLKNESFILNCGGSASTLRFLMPLASALDIECDFKCEKGLAERPMAPLLACLGQHGCLVEGRDPKHLKGKLTPGTFTLPGDVSSQFVTGLLMALPLLDEASKVVVEGRLQSGPYVDLTLQVLSAAGIRIEETRGADRCEFLVEGGQKYELPELELQNIEGDWSGGAFWIVMDAMLRMKDEDPEGLNKRRIIISGLNPASMQGDKEIVPIAGRILSPESDKRDADMNIDAADIPDLVPALAALVCARPSGSVTNIINAGRLRYKESDRLHTARAVLSELGADIVEGSDSLRIISKGKLQGGEVDSFGDHRIAMMAAAAACISEAPVTIRGAKAVNKSYPNFYEDYQKLGGEVQWL